MSKTKRGFHLGEKGFPNVLRYGFAHEGAKKRKERERVWTAHAAGVRGRGCSKLFPALFLSTVICVL